MDVHVYMHIRVGQAKVQRKMYRVAGSMRLGMKGEKEARLVAEFMGNG